MGMNIAVKKSMRTTIVCGMLGSGKTTFIQNILKGSKQKVVVLVNDFGMTGIDGEILSIDGIEAIELPSGCVCCTLKFDLITMIERVMKEYNPDHLYIEPSGVASPSGVLDALDSLRICSVLVVGIVDATEFLEFHESEMFGSFLEDQIINADIILINKTDLTDNDRTKRTVTIIRAMNDSAVIIPTVNAVIRESLPDITHATKYHGEHNHSIQADTLSFPLKDKPKLIALQNLFNTLLDGRYGNIMRAKALVHTDMGPYRVDLSSGQTAITPLKRSVSESRLVVIGNDLKESTLRKAIELLH